jgi:hypothetical protein
MQSLRDCCAKQQPFTTNRSHTKFLTDLAQRIEQGLDKLGRRLEHARRALDRGKLERQIGRLLERNARAAGRYLIDLGRGSLSASRSSSQVVGATGLG